MFFFFSLSSKFFNDDYPCYQTSAECLKIVGDQGPLYPVSQKKCVGHLAGTSCCVKKMWNYYAFKVVSSALLEFHEVELLKQIW